MEGVRVRVIVLVIVVVPHHRHHHHLLLHLFDVLIFTFVLESVVAAVDLCLFTVHGDTCDLELAGMFSCVVLCVALLVVIVIVVVSMWSVVDCSCLRLSMLLCYVCCC